LRRVRAPSISGPQPDVADPMEPGSLDLADNHCVLASRHASAPPCLPLHLPVLLESLSVRSRSHKKDTKRSATGVNGRQSHS
jgi:hypothetical protein